MELPYIIWSTHRWNLHLFQVWGTSPWNAQNQNQKSNRMSKYILAFDQGTTSSRALIFDQNGKALNMAQREFTQIFPEPGWVEHDPMEILSTQIGVAAEVVSKTKVKSDEIAAIGITNQRETTVVWDRTTGEPIYNAIVWQDRRTSDYCDMLISQGHEPMVREKTGLVIES